MPLTREKLFRDPVHDLIAFDLDDPGDRLLLRLIDSREFQRLRRIRQIGMAHFAFHGAEHSRFGHGIGTLHLARRILARLGKGRDLAPETVIAVHAAALLHDIGHGPYSHVIEKFLPQPHEYWTCRAVLDPWTEVNQILTDHDAELPRRVVAVMEGRLAPPWVNSIVSSQLDADRFDYLLRDSLMTGVKYGVFDLERLIMMLRVDEDEHRIIVSRKGMLPVEKYLQSRYHMYRQVYFHKTVTSAEAMLIAILRRAARLLEEGKWISVANDHLVGFLTKQLHIEDYMSFDDSVIQSALVAWTEADDGVLRDLSRRLMRRQTFKVLEIEGFDESDIVNSSRIQEARELIRATGFDPEYYFLTGQSEDRPYKPYNPREGSARGTIWVEDPADPATIRDIRDCSPTVRAFTESEYSIWRAFFPAELGNLKLRERLTRLFRS